MSENAKQALHLHETNQGKWNTSSNVSVTPDTLPLVYTPGVGAVCMEIHRNPDKAAVLTPISNTVAVVTDGTAVLGLGDIGPVAGYPVMEGKCCLFKHFAGINAVPICLNTKSVDEIVRTVKCMAPSFGGINLEDISAPRCFEIENRLSEELDIPVFHDDQHGTAIVVLAGLYNALKVVHKRAQDVRIVILGAGAAGIAIANLLKYADVGKEIVLLDSRGILPNERTDSNPFKKKVCTFTNPRRLKGGLDVAMKDADVFVGVSGPGLLTQEHVRSMNKDAIVFALSNPVPEIMPNEAKKAGARVVATGRSDFPNQLNNAVVFPALFKGLFLSKQKKVTDEIKVRVARSLANMVKRVTEEEIVPGIFDKGLVDLIVDGVCNRKGCL